MSGFLRHTGAARISVRRLKDAGARRIRRRRQAVHVDAPKVERTKPSFLRFAGASLACTAVDQLLAALLFSLLRRPLARTGFVRILISSLLARCVSLALNYTLNHRLVFTLDVDDPEWQRSARRESLPRFLALAALVIALSTLGVYCAHTLLGVPEWQAKIVVDIALFFLNYNVQRTWVFRNDVTVSADKVRRRRP